MSNTDEVRTTSATGGQKGVKPQRFDLIPVVPLTILAELYGFGAMKYEDRNWERGYEWSKSYAALQRHATAWWGGEDFDAESGLSHMASVAWHAFALLEFMSRPKHYGQYDDRPDPVARRVDSEPTHEMIRDPHRNNLFSCTGCSWTGCGGEQFVKTIFNQQHEDQPRTPQKPASAHHMVQGHNDIYFCAGCSWTTVAEHFDDAVDSFAEHLEGA